MFAITRIIDTITKGWIRRMPTHLGLPSVGVRLSVAQHLSLPRKLFRRSCVRASHGSFTITICSDRGFADPRLCVDCAMLPALAPITAESGKCRTTRDLR